MQPVRIELPELSLLHTQSTEYMSKTMSIHHSQVNLVHKLGSFREKEAIPTSSKTTPASVRMIQVIAKQNRTAVFASLPIFAVNHT
eukprot:4419525-Amphidinium_carterae.1